MHVLVTGGCGFIGSHGVEALLARGDRVTVLDDLSTGARENLAKGAQLVMGDVADATLVARLTAEADEVLHLAAIASVPVCEAEPARAQRVNVAGTENIFQAASARGIPVVYASSAAVYGDNPNLPLSETATPAPRGAYGRHKLENEAIAARYAGRVPSVGLRFFNVYGPRQDPRSAYSGVISKFAANALSGAPLTIFGDGEQTRDFIYVGDVVALLLAALSVRGGTHLYNGCTGRATSLTQLAEAVGTASANPLVLHHEAPRAGDIRHSLGDPSKAKTALGFTAQTRLNDGLRILVKSL